MTQATRPDIEGNPAAHPYTASPLRVTSLGMRAGLHTLRVVAGSPTLDRLRLRAPAEKALRNMTRETVRTFARVPGIGKPVRQRPARQPDLFDLTPTDEQAMLVEALREFAVKLRSLAKDADAACEADVEDEVGIALLGVPEALGGLTEERSSVTGVLAAEALGHGDMGLATALLAPAGVAAAISRFGDSSQQATYLPALIDGASGAFALLEPGPLFDPFELKTTARDGRITGEKALVPLAARADLLLVAAATEDGPAVFIVEQWDSRPEPAMGIRAAATARVRFDDVPGELLCAGADYGELVDRARLAWCALATGCSRAVLDYVIPYVNERRAFGEPLSHRQAVAFTVSDIAIELEAMRLLTLRAATLIDRGEDAGHAVGLARRFAAEKAAAIGSHGVQLLGGHGYVTEHPVERWYRDLRAAGVMEGALAL